MSGRTRLFVFILLIYMTTNTDTANLTADDLERIEDLTRLLSAGAPAITLNRMIQAALAHPRLLRLKPDTIAANVEKAAALLNISQDAYAKAALKMPTLFYQSPDTVAWRVRKLSTLLAVEPQRIVRAAERSPALLLAAPLTVADRLVELQDVLSLSRDACIELGLANPSTLLTSPASLKKRLAETAAALAVPVADVVHAAGRASTILSLTPHRLLPLLNGLRVIACQEVNDAYRYKPPTAIRFPRHQ